MIKQSCFARKDKVSLKDKDVLNGRSDPIIRLRQVEILDITL